MPGMVRKAGKDAADSLEEKILSGIRDMAKLASEDPDKFREVVRERAFRVGRGAERLSQFADAAADAVQSNPRVQRELQNYFLQIMGKQVEKIVDEPPPRWSGSRPRQEPKREPKRAGRRRRQERARPRETGHIQAFFNDLFYGPAPRRR